MAQTFSPVHGSLRVPTTPVASSSLFRGSSCSASFHASHEEVLQEEMVVKRRELAARKAKVEQEETRLRKQRSDAAIIELNRWHSSGNWSLSRRRLQELYLEAGDDLPAELTRAIFKCCGSL